MHDKGVSCIATSVALYPCVQCLHVRSVHVETVWTQDGGLLDFASCLEEGSYVGHTAFAVFANSIVAPSIQHVHMEACGKVVRKPENIISNVFGV